MLLHLYKPLLLHDIMFVNHAHNRNEQGAVMLFALLVLTVMMTIGFVLASLVFREIRIAQTFRDSVRSYYAAESGIEQSLDLLSVVRRDDGLLDDASATDDAIDLIHSITSGGPIQLAYSGASYEIVTDETTGSVNSVVFPVPQHRGVQVDVYDPDDVFSTASAQSVEFEWNEVSCQNSRIEVTYQQFDVTDLAASDDLVHKDVYTCLPAPADSEYGCHAVSNIPTETKNYLIRIAALDCTLPRMEVTFYQQDNAVESGGVEPIPSIAHIGVTGSGSRTERHIEATTHWIPRASGLTDFVLFSIDTIEKFPEFAGPGGGAPGGGGNPISPQ